jgi:hypothetical protein
MTFLNEPKIYGSHDQTEIYSLFRGNRDCDPALFRARIMRTGGEFQIRMTMFTSSERREIGQQIVEHYDVAKFYALVALEKAAQAYAAAR